MIALGFVAASLQTAAASGDWDDCVKKSRAAAIAACTRVIDSGIYSGRVLAQAYSNRGIELTARSDLVRALTDFDEAMCHDPRQAAVFNNRGLAHAAKGDFDRAIADYDQAIERDPRIPPRSTIVDWHSRRRASTAAPSLTTMLQSKSSPSQQVYQPRQRPGLRCRGPARSQGCVRALQPRQRLS